MAIHPEKPKFSIKLPKIPRDEEAFVKTIGLARRSILEACPVDKYPIMQERQTRLASADRLHLQPNQQITELEEELKPPEAILAYTALIDAGLPEQQARKRLYQTLQGAKFFVDLASESAQLYFPKEQFAGLFSEKPIERSDAAMDLGLSYIYASFSMLIEPQDVAQNLQSFSKTNG